VQVEITYTRDQKKTLRPLFERLKDDSDAEGAETPGMIVGQFLPDGARVGYICGTKALRLVQDLGGDPDERVGELADFKRVHDSRCTDTTHAPNSVNKNAGLILGLVLYALGGEVTVTAEQVEEFRRKNYQLTTQMPGSDGSVTFKVQDCPQHSKGGAD
jgi:hypothetical protein